MPHTYKLLVEAMNDYMAAYEWYENKQEGLGNRFLKEVRLKMDAVTQYPEVYSSKGKIGFREAKVPYFPYIIIYKLYKQERVVLITAVHHAKKHPQKKYRRN